MSISQQEFNNFKKLIQEKSAIVLDPGKEYLIENRLTPLAKEVGLDSLTELFQKIKSNTELLAKVVDAITTNETLFFRDQHPFETLKKIILPNLIKAREDKKELNIWSSACSAGQEAYSIAIILKENFPQLSNWKVKILCTDISHAMLERVKSGVFSQLEVNRGMPVTLLVKYFRQKGTDWVVSDALKEMLEVRYLNLAAVWPALCQMDLIFLRNVLIYFDLKAKEEILQKIQKNLCPDGCLFLGSTESMLTVNSSFKAVKYDRTVIYTK
ncbi:MAG: protein-glutamate O-methyltransferase CheR [Deltaproteobacteria bacterium]|jgi:chemotaxis protein methyltransferase CheR|nr:protein-glutamate O-methyltransferase CheR [Deltaproteobacteria bacterium]